MTTRLGALLLGLGVLAGPRARAQGQATPAQPVGNPPMSLGQPRLWQPYAVALATRVAGSGSPRALMVGGVHRAFMNPVSGLIGVAAEGYFDARSRDDGGLRLMAASRSLALSAGIDLSVRTGDIDAVVSYQTAIRRGGLLGHGTLLRADWLPGRDEFGLGLHLPLLQPFAGKTRERSTRVRLGGSRAPATHPDVALPAEVATALADAAESAAAISAFTNLYSANAERVLISRGSVGYPATLQAYEDALDVAFVRAAGDSAAGHRCLSASRAILLDRVILPFNSTFGQVRDGAELDGLGNAASRRFRQWLIDSSRVDIARHATLAATHDRWMEVIRGVHRGLAADWDDSRLIWLPLQLALPAGDYDDQSEVDELIARAVGHPFTDHNALAYLNSIDLPLEIARSIYAARDYHVLWTHDFAGRTRTGELDNVGFSMVADVYLPALIESVKRYDSTGRMPVYLLLLDQFWYEPNDGRIWMNILEDPLNAAIRFAGDTARESHLRDRQAALRAAVAASARMQRDVRAGVDARRVVKVHVSITNPADFSFRSSHIAPPLPFTPDNVMRDHRKIAFHDLNEADPYRGSMILMGVGVGEHYASPTWEDRGYRIRGPAALEARGALRRFLRRQGFGEDDIPLPLRSIASAPAAEARMNLGDYVGRALQVHNESGFGPKEASVARAMLYNLAPPGSVIIVPDPLWVSETWAGLLAGAAARGSRVFIIAPALANAPSPEAAVMAMAHDVLTRLIGVGRALGARPGRAPGELRVGLYAAAADVNDAAGRAREVREGLARSPWIRTVIPFDATTLAVLENVASDAAASGDAASLAQDARPRAPMLHQKTQMIALPGAISALVRQPAWRDALAQSIRGQSRQAARLSEQLGFLTPDVDTAAMRRNDALLNAYEQSRSDAERARASFYFSVGTQNQDPRGLALDGEATIVVSGFHAAAGVVDLHNVMARSRWVATEEELNRHLPAPRGLARRIARLIRALL